MTCIVLAQVLAPYHFKKHNKRIGYWWTVHKLVYMATMFMDFVCNITDLDLYSPDMQEQFPSIYSDLQQFGKLYFCESDYLDASFPKSVRSKMFYQAYSP